MASINQILDAIGQKGALAQNRPPLTVTPTRLPSFNTEIMKIGGIAGGRIYELFAPPSAGKSTLAQIICADYQRAGKIAAYFDVEATTQTETNLEEKQSWMSTMGINVEELITPNFGSAEELFEIVKTLVVSGVNLIVIDTVAVLQPAELIFREDETVKMNERMALPKALTSFFNGIVGGFAAKNIDGEFLPVPSETKRYLSQYGVTIKDTYVNEGGKKKARPSHKLWYYDCAIIGINHAKNMIGVMYGDPTYTPGGAALGFHSSVRIGMNKPSKSKETVKIGGYDVPAYRKTTITAPKNKLAAPFGEMAIRVYQDGRVVEDVPFFVTAEQKGLVSVSSRNVTILVGEFAGTVLRKPEFETWVTENPAFLETVDDSVEIEETVPVDTPKIKIGLFSKELDSQESFQKTAFGIKLNLSKS